MERDGLRGYAEGGDDADVKSTLCDGRERS